MASCSCFGKKKDKDNNGSDDEEDRRIQSSQQAGQMSSAQVSTQVENQGEEAEDGRLKARVFSYQELAYVTHNFRESDRIGEGGFGPVYKGFIQRTGQTVAVKKLNHSGFQGDKEFLVEVLMLNLLRHENLVNLIGYCAEDRQRLLVYEYLPSGSLESHLHDLKRGMEPLNWSTRVMIAIGAAKGLNYLHNEASPPVIYRDLKSSNILLDEHFKPKLSDFGLAKFGPTEDKSHVSTRVMGTHGYCAPEYAGTGRLTMKSDIYSFGILLLEMITGRRPLDHNRERREQILLDWARPNLNNHNYLPLADPNLRGQFSESSLRKVVEVLRACLRQNHHNRPHVSEIIATLDNALALNFNPSAAEVSISRRHKDPVTSDAKGSGETGRRRSISIGGEGSGSRDREKAVAEARKWGESWRERRGASQDGDKDLK